MAERDDSGPPTNPLPPLDQCEMTLVGVTTLVQHLQSHPTFSGVDVRRLRVMAIGYLTFNGTTDSRHSVPLGNLHPAHHAVHTSSSPWRTSLRSHFVSLVTDMVCPTLVRCAACHSLLSNSLPGWIACPGALRSWSTPRARARRTHTQSLRRLGSTYSCPLYSFKNPQNCVLSLRNLFKLTLSTSLRLPWSVGTAQRVLTPGALSTKRMCRDYPQGGSGAPISSPRAQLRTGSSMVGR